MAGSCLPFQASPVPYPPSCHSNLLNSAVLQTHQACSWTFSAQISAWSTSYHSLPTKTALFWRDFSWPPHLNSLLWPSLLSYFILFVSLITILIVLHNSLFTSFFFFLVIYTYYKFYSMQAGITPVCLVPSCISNIYRRSSIQVCWMNKHRFPASQAPALWVKPQLSPFIPCQIFANK